MEHGYSKYKTEGCRCYVCGYGVSLYEAERKKQIIAGTWHPFVDDMTEVREHIAAHSRTGVGSRRLAELAGVDRKAIQEAMNPRRRPGHRMRRVSAERILAVPVAGAEPAGHTPIDASGVHRRVQALCAIGWGFGEQSRRGGWPRDRWHRLLKEGHVLPSTLAMVRRVYDELSMTRAPVGYAASRILVVARREGWLPPLAWDDDTIDDPDAVPRLGLLDRSEDADEGIVWLTLHGHLAVEEIGSAERAVVERHRAAHPVGQRELIERYLKLAAQGVGRTDAARLIGVSLVNLYAALNRARGSGDDRIAMGRYQPRAMAG